LSFDRLETHFGAALRELEQIGIIRLQAGGAIIPVPGNEDFFAELTEPRGTLGIRSVFYFAGHFQYHSAALIRGADHLFCVDFSEPSMLSSLNTAEAAVFIGGMLTPVEEPPLAAMPAQSVPVASAPAPSIPTLSAQVASAPAPSAPVSQPIPAQAPPPDALAAQRPAAGVRACPVCGHASTGKFCKNCGAPQPALSDPPAPQITGADKATCPNCANPISPSARFCKKCGTKM
ncbi:MAG: zinc ribbon domain-containing protein, partial [Clostridia bacterium]|nr:zinc ribbon domain-containing protein [Clostridia bacterium]